MLGLSPVRKSFIGTLCVVALVIFVLPVMAGTTSYSGALSNTDPQFTRVTTPAWSTPGCAGLAGTSTYYYDVQPFYVDATGTYDLDMLASSTFDTYNILYLGSFDPSNAMLNCVNASDDADGSTRGRINTTLTAGVQYFHVVSSFSTNMTGTYHVSMTGPGNIILGLAPTPEQLAMIPFHDGRINNMDQWATFAVYCPDDNIEVYAIDATGAGQIAFTTTPEEVAAVGVPTSGNAIIEEGRGVTLYRLSSGEFQVVGPRDAEWKTYNVMFTSCGLSGVVRTFMYP